ncbi:MAG: hypothetical protein ACI97B_003200 [Verrucomicrobiales bacterium]|jgi:hypothetical protein
MKNTSRRSMKVPTNAWMWCLAGVIISGCGRSIYAESPISTWTDSTGRSVQARFVDLQDRKVTLKQADGRVITLPIHRLDDISVAKAQALAGPDPASPAAVPDAVAPALHGTSGKEVASLHAANIHLVIEGDGDAFLSCTGGETFPLELSPRVHVVKNGQKDRVRAKAQAAPKVSDHEAILFLAVGTEMSMELHYELNPAGECLVWYRFKNTGASEAESQVRVGFPQLVAKEALGDGYVKNRTEEAMTEAQVRSWLGRKTIKMSGFKGYGSDKMSYTKPAAKDTSGTFKSLSIDAGTYHDQPLRMDAPKSRDAQAQFFMLGDLKPLNGFSVRLSHAEPWERSDRSLGLTLHFK